MCFFLALESYSIRKFGFFNAQSERARLGNVRGITLEKMSSLRLFPKSALSFLHIFLDAYYDAG